MKSKKFLSLVLAGLAGIGLVATSACSNTSDTMANTAAAEAFTITAAPFSHWHTLNYQKVSFTVTDKASGQGKAGLPVEIQMARATSQEIKTFTVKNGTVKDEGNGVYSVNTSAPEFYPYAFIARFIYNGQLFVSQPYVTEITKGGEEGIKIEAKGTSYVYQIRNFWRPGEIYASDNGSVLLSFEIMRGVPEGTAINWSAPYANFAEHVINATNTKIVIESADGKVKAEIPAINKSKGVYEATRVFSKAEVGQGMDYNVKFYFTDPYNGATVTSVNAYKLHANAAK